MKYETKIKLFVLAAIVATVLAAAALAASVPLGPFTVQGYDPGPPATITVTADPDPIHIPWDLDVNCEFIPPGWFPMPGERVTIIDFANPGAGRGDGDADIIQRVP